MPPIHGPRRFLGLAAWLAVTYLAAFIGARFEPGAWYDTLAKPAWNPPPWVFAPVWTILYALMAVAAWRVWRRGGWHAAHLPLALYLFQLALNALWSYLFFGRHRPDLAFADVVALWLAIVAVLLTFRRSDRLAAWLLVPYLAWTTFASALNLAVWRLNGGWRG